jgi:hypothetical protein
MERIKTYFTAFVWQAGLGYLALWGLTLWALDTGSSVFGHSGACRPELATVMFYWVCDLGGPLALLATLANFALTATIWAPVYVAAATVEPGALALALPIVLVHVVGLPMAIFVAMRLSARAFDVMRLMVGRVRPDELAGAAAVGPPAGLVAFAAAEAKPAASPPIVGPRGQFGLRGNNPTPGGA